MEARTCPYDEIESYETNKLDDGVKHLAIDEADLILTNWVEGVDAQHVNGLKTCVTILDPPLHLGNDWQENS